MDIVLGILILLAICGSRAAANGLTLLIGVPLGLLAAFAFVALLAAGVQWLLDDPPLIIVLVPVASLACILWMSNKSP